MTTAKTIILVIIFSVMVISSLAIGVRTVITIIKSPENLHPGAIRTFFYFIFVFCSLVFLIVAFIHKAIVAP